MRDSLENIFMPLDGVVVDVKAEYGSVPHL